MNQLDRRLSALEAKAAITEEPIRTYLHLDQDWVDSDLYHTYDGRQVRRADFDRLQEHHRLIVALRPEHTEATT